MSKLSDWYSKNFEEKMAGDVLWNLGSLAAIGLLSIAINLIILKAYGTETLGVFNQVYAIYIVVSQLCVFGIHLSVQRYTPEHSENLTTSATVTLSACVLALIATLIFVALLYVSRFSIGNLMESPAVTIGIRDVIPGLLAFSLNKILLSHLNGHRHMKAYGFFQALRFLFMTGCLVLFLILKVSEKRILLILSGAEIALLIILVAYLGRRLWGGLRGDLLKWIHKHARFGSQVFLGNLLLDTNSRVDVLMLGILMSDSAVGIYSIAAILFDGFMQLPYILRLNINPVITKTYREQSKQQFDAFTKETIKRSYRVLIPFGILSSMGILVFLYIAKIQEFALVSGAVIVLMAGALLSSGYLPMQTLFSQVGRPGLQTAFCLSIVLTNIVLNFVLIPIFGIMGAAFASSGALVFLIGFYLYFYSRRVL